jgi:hypothetical protein
MKNRRIVDEDDTLTFVEMLESAPDALIITNEAGAIVLINGLTEQVHDQRDSRHLDTEAAGSRPRTGARTPRPGQRTHAGGARDVSPDVALGAARHADPFTEPSTPQ